MKTYIGLPVPDDMFTFFAELTAYKCVLCNHTYAGGMQDIEEDLACVAVECSSVVDNYGRPLGLVCKRCKPRFINFTYRSE